MEKLSNFINGAYTPPETGLYLDNYQPATGEVYSQVPDSSPADVERAYSAAEQAFPGWSTLAAEEKFKILNRIAEGIDTRREELAQAESRDQGKPVWLARTEINRAGQNFRFFATAALQFASESHSMEDRAINYTLRQPIGVVGCISPWNLPLYLFTWKIAPALAAGNCVVAKPSEFTPYTAALLGQICNDAGLPAGVLNIVHGLGGSAGQAIISHPGIKAISFTGGTATGRHIASVAAPMFKKMSLELGGKNPNIIFADADLEKAISTTVRSSFQNQGEICLCGSRVFIERPVYEKVKNALVEEVKKLKTGNPQLDESRVGAIVSRQHYEKVLSYIQLAKDEGGTILCGGEALHPPGFENGWFIAPTIIEGLDAACRTNQEEIFGPVITLIPFDSEESVLTMANSTAYGLATTLWTGNLSRAHRLAGKLQTGIVWVNCWLLRDLRTPFGGTKQSGVGREGGWEAMRFFTEPKNVCIAY
ncbi:MAG: aldehyde dehydrogenase [Bacteroidetes bacterium]|nr:aldehyde dehydrogenase [Bacteroidota bacterium]